MSLGLPLRGRNRTKSIQNSIFIWKICRIFREATPYTELTLTYNNLKLNFGNCNLPSEKPAIFRAELGKKLIN